ncbi:MAG: hypothetical protein PVF13_04105 [Chromatiales bacterium]|jgi:hypothetical protein
MCITIPSSANVKRARQWVVWQWLAASPLRLYLIGGTLLSIAALVVEWVGLEAAAGWSQFNLHFALLPTLLLGVLFEWLPAVLKVTPLTYVRYTSLFFLLLLSQLLFYAGLFWGQSPGLLYLLPLGLVWGISLQTLRGMLKLSYVAVAGIAVAVFYLLLLLGGAGLFIAIGLVGGWRSLMPTYAWAWLIPLYLSALLVLLILHLKTRSARGR